MENLNLPPFYVGQKVVAIIDSTMGLFKKGDVFIVLDINQTPCCKKWKVDIGLPLPKGFDCAGCVACNVDFKYKPYTAWSSIKFFAPIESTFQSITFKEVIKIESPLIGIN